LPTIPGSPASGAVIKPRGIGANIRGIRHKGADGVQARPDLILLDDPQTDESARNPERVTQQLETLNKAILRLGGHKRRLAAVCNATIIECDDMIDQLADRKKHPAWQTERIPMLRSYAKHQDDFWLGPYADARNSYSADLPGDQERAHREATQLYAQNRELADEGAEATWVACFEEGTEISAIQHAYNIIIDTGMDAFMAECQNQPVRDTSGLVLLTPDEICRKQCGYARDAIPPECTLLTAFVDVHPEILYWQVWAWQQGFTGYLISYGTFPDQRRRHFAHNHLLRKLRQLFGGCDTSAKITAGLNGLLHGYEPESWHGLLARQWSRLDGVPMRIGCALCDANGEESDTVKAVIRQSQFASILAPSFGVGIGAKGAPMSRYHGYKSKIYGPEWMPTKPRPGEPQGIKFDSNYWKTRFHRALALPAGSRGALYLHKAQPADHRQLADHWNAEKAKEVTANGRLVYEFVQKPGADNHYLDCAVGNMVAASRAGIKSVVSQIAPKQKRRRKVTYVNER
jgi:hypothetical protein